MPDFLSSNTTNFFDQNFVYGDAKLGTVPSLLGEYGNGRATLGTARHGKNTSDSSEAYLLWC
jgi:hypothetical protein